MKTPIKNQQGIAHIALVVIILAVLGVIGFAGYTVVKGKKDGGVSNSVAKAVAEAKCEEEDKNICKFQAGWKAQEYYTIVSKTSGDGVNSESTYRTEGEDKFHLTASGETPYEMIVIGDTTYTKASTGTWWKKTTKKEEVKQFSDSYDFDTEDEDTTSDEPKDTTTYKALGTEPCGKLTCYKYQVIDSSAPDDKSFIWFDTKDYQLRKTRDEAKDGTVSESTFNYDKISIKAPTPVKELGPNQYLVPGQAEPQTMPDAASIQQSIDLQSDASVDSSADATFEE